MRSFVKESVFVRGTRLRVVFLLLATALVGFAAKLKKDDLAPQFSTRTGVFTNVVKLELSASGAVVRFTTDGTEPTADSEKYEKPINVNRCMVVRARAFHTNGLASGIVSHSYVIASGDLSRFSSDLPLVVVNALGEIERDAKTLAGLHVLENRPERTTIPDRANFTGLALLNIRGYSSLRYPKKSYSVKLVDEAREPWKQTVLGMPKESDWVLYGPYPDKTMLRDVLAYDLNRAMGYWAPRWRFVEVFLATGEGPLSMDNYVGLYVFEEKVTRDKSRVNIVGLDTDDSAEPDITGGYIFKKDHASRGERRRFEQGGPPMAGTFERAGFPTGPGGFPADPKGFTPARVNDEVEDGPPRRGGRSGPRLVRGFEREMVPRILTNRIGAPVRDFVGSEETASPTASDLFVTKLQRNQFYYVDPEPDEITAVQRAWLQDYVNRFEAVLYSTNFTNPKDGYRAFIDVDSFIDFHLFSEATKNVDSFRFSTFYHKDRGGLLKMGPVWDWNLAFGNCEGKQGYMPENWLWPQLNDQEYSWFRRLFEDPDFGQRYVDRCAQLRTNIFATSNVLARIDALAAQLEEAQKRNFARWDILGREINPNYFVGETYAEEVQWMKRWLSNRLAWIEAQFVATPGMSQGALNSTTEGAQIYFTTDGRDPRAPGGEPAAYATLWKPELKLTSSQRVVARARVDKRWSAPLHQP